MAAVAKSPAVLAAENMSLATTNSSSPDAVPGEEYEYVSPPDFRSHSIRWSEIVVGCEVQLGLMEAEKKMHQLTKAQRGGHGIGKRLMLTERSLQVERVANNFVLQLRSFTSKLWLGTQHVGRSLRGYRCKLHPERKSFEMEEHK